MARYNGKPGLPWTFWRRKRANTGEQGAFRISLNHIAHITRHPPYDVNIVAAKHFLESLLDTAGDDNPNLSFP